MKTFANLPDEIQIAISELLGKQEASDWLQRAVALHEQYTTREKGQGHVTLKTYDDALAYLAMRIPATYAQLYSAMEQVQEVLPFWKPQSILDLGSGPGTATWAAQEVWPTIHESLSMDSFDDFISLGKRIHEQRKQDGEIKWKNLDLRKGLISDRSYDIVVIGNVFNELRPQAAEKLLGQAFRLCKGVLLVVEPGTPFGSSIVQNAARKLAKSAFLVAPYVQNSFVQSEDYYLHFTQRFIRPDFQRRVRQHMRENSLLASDWEETKFSYAAISTINSEVTAWGRCIGPIEIQKGFLEIPVLTGEKIEKVKVMKRDTKDYAFAKDLKWGQLITSKFVFRT